MDILKEILFNETLYHSQEYLRLKKNLGEYDTLVNLQHAKFHALYTVIESSMLEKEYLNRKENGKSDEQPLKDISN